MLDTRQANHRHGEEWYTCDFCGFDYPRSRMIVQNGRTVCQGKGTMRCREKPGWDPARKGPLPTERPIPPLPSVNEEI